MRSICAVILASCLCAAGSSTSQAQENTAYGTGALPSNSGGGNVAFGFDTLYSNTSLGGYNVAIGSGAMYSNTGGYYNSATGFNALYSNTTGDANTATGYDALYHNTTGMQNTATGVSALKFNRTGNYNTATGLNALLLNSTGSYNTASGHAALTNNTDGYNNTATGANALISNTTGYENASTGVGTLYDNTTGHFNTATGDYALFRNVYGNYNIGIGAYAGMKITEGSYNIAIGNQGVASDNGAIRIGTAGQQTSFYAAGVAGVQVGGIPVYINSDGQLGTVNSSIRFKQDVHDMGDASDGLFLLRPVTYRYKQAYQDGSKPVDYGLIAEEVAQVYPDMVARDANGQILTVQYQKLTPMLLNEVQKQQQQMEAQQKTIEKLLQRLSALESSTDLAASRTQ